MKLKKIIIRGYFFLWISVIQGNPSFAEFVHNRFYYIRRLEQSVPRIIKNEKKIIDFLNSFDNFPYENSDIPFKHPLIHQAFLSIFETKTLQAYSHLWNQFNSYHLIEDILFLDEFIKGTAYFAIFFLKKNEFVSDDFKILYTHDIAQLDREQCLLLIRMACDTTVTHTELFFRPFSSITEIERQIHPLVEIDIIAERFYHIHRLEQAIQFLYKSVQKKDFLIMKDMLISFGESHSNHQIIMLYIKKIENEGSIQPFFDLWELIKRYEYIQDEQLIKDFSSLLFTFYADLFIYYAEYARRASKPEFQSTVQQIIELYQQVEKLPIDQILDAIDILTQELPPLIELCTAKSTGSWREWVKKYWWVPPVIIVTVVYKILKKIAFPKFSQTHFNHSGNSLNFEFYNNKPAVLPHVGLEFS